MFLIKCVILFHKLKEFVSLAQILPEKCFIKFNNDLIASILIASLLLGFFQEMYHTSIRVLPRKQNCRGLLQRKAIDEILKLSVNYLDLILVSDLPIKNFPTCNLSPPAQTFLAGRRSKQK